jgi:iron(III) transport system permease protein
VGNGGSLQPERLLERGRETLIVAAGTTVASFVLGAVIALGAARLRIPGRKAWLLCALLPLFIPPYVSSIAAVRTLGAQGWVTRILVPGSDELPLGPVAPPAAGLASDPRAARIAAASAPLQAAPIYSRAGVIGVLTFSFLPLVVLGGWALLGLSDPEAEEWALLHAGTGTVLRRVVLPRALPGLAVGAAAAFLLSLTEFGVPEALRTYPVLSVEVYTQMGVFYAPRAGAVAGLALIALALAGGLVLAILLRFLLPGLADLRSRLALPGLAGKRLLAPRRGGRLAWTLALGLLTGLPLLVVVGTLMHSSVETEGLASWKAAWTTGRDEVLASAGLGILAAGLCLLLGRWMAGPVRGSRANPPPTPDRPVSFWTIAALVGLFLPVALPGPVVATGWSQMLSEAAAWGRGPESSWVARVAGDTAAAVLDGPWALMLAWVGRWAPLAFGLLAVSLRQVPHEWIEAARLEGAGPWARWRLLEWPVLYRPLLAAGALIFCLSLGEVGASILLLPPGTTTLGVRLMTLMHYAPTATVSALALISMILGLAAAAVMAAAWKIGRRSTVSE